LKTKSVIFADLDGTFLDDKYSYHTTKPIVNQLLSLGGSIVFCSSKTRNEIEYYRKAVDINEPFIAENGAAIYIPKNYFTFSYKCSKTSSYDVIRLGAAYGVLRQKLAEIKEKTAAVIVGFGDMTLEELAYDTGLPLNLAKLAQKREHDEPFRIVKGNRMHVLNAIKDSGLHCTEGGRYFHLTGNTDKGKAVNVLKNLYRQMFGVIETVGVGDGPNDLPMLKAVCRPFFIKNKSDVDMRLNVWLNILQTLGKAKPYGTAEFNKKERCYPLIFF
jgi:mannosyl-3-phosphoglycerate phosphatase